MNSPVGFYNICECMVSLDAGVHCRRSVIEMIVLVGNSDTSLLFFLKGHVDKLVNSDGMF